MIWTEPHSVWEAWSGRDVMPLAMFPAEQAREIDRLASQPTPPPKMKDLGCAQIPSRAWWEWHVRRGINPDKIRESIPFNLREMVVERDCGICQLCQRPLERDDVIHLDHVIPVSRGGRNKMENLQLAHAICNLRKGNRA